MKSMGIQEMDLSSIDLLLVQKRWTRQQETGFGGEERKIVELGELEWGENRLETRMLSEFDFQREQWLKPNPSRKVADKIRRTFGFGKKELAEEIENRGIFLEQEARRRTGWEEFFRMVNSQCRN